MARTVGQMVAEATAAVAALSVAEVQRHRQADPNTLVVDVRDSADARAGGVIPGAINVAYGNLPRAVRLLGASEVALERMGPSINPATSQRSIV